MDAVNLEDLTPVSAKDANPWGVDVNQLEEINEGTSVDMVGVGSIEPVQQKKQTAQYGDAALVNLFSEQEVADLEKKGKIGFAELAMRQKTGDILPFSPTGIVDSVKLISASNRIKANEYTDDKQRDDDTALITAYGRRKAEEYVRGFTWGAKAYDITSKMPAFAIETAVGIGIAKRAGMYAATKAGEAIAKKTALRKTAEIAGTTAIATAIQPNRYIAKYADQMVTEDLAITDHGIDIMRVAEKEPAKAFMIAIGDTAIENFSEIYGGAFIGKGAGFIGAKLPKKFTEEFAKAYAKIKPTGSVADLMSNAGWHGALEEFGEERLADLLRAATGVDERDISFFDKVSQALFPSAEDALVELGVFATIGAGSAYTQRVVNDLRSRGMSEEDIQRQIDAKSEKERIEWSKTITDRYTVEKYREDLKEKFGLTEEEVTAQVILTDQIAKSKGITTEDYVGAYIAGIEEGKDGEHVAGLAQEEDALLTEARKYKSAEEFVKAQGSPVYHGTSKKFEAFENGKDSSTGIKSGALFFTKDKSIAGTYGDRVVESFVKLDTPIEIDFEGKSTVFFDGKYRTPSQLSKRLQKINQDMKNRYQLEDDLADELDNLGWNKSFADEIDGAILKNINDVGPKGDFLDTRISDHVFVFDSSKIKTTSQLTDIWNKAHGNVLAQEDQTLIEEARKYKSAEEFVNASSEKVFRGSGSGKGSGVDLFGSGTYYTNDINEAKYYGNKISETLLKNSDFFDGTKVLGENELKEITDGIDKITKSKIGSQYFDNVVSWYEGDVPKNLISFKRVIDELGTDKKFFDASKKLGIKQNQLNPDADIANLINKALESKGYKGAKFRSDEIESLVDEGLGKGTAYIVWGKETDVRKELADIWNKAHGNVLGQDVKGTVTFGEDGRAIIRAFSSADISTAIHELAHIARRTALSPEEQKTVARWAGALSESGEIVWTVPAEEKFARGFERYLLDNKKPAKGLEDIFNKISEWLKTIYANLASVDVAISPAVSKVFDRITSGKEYIAPLKGRDGMLKAYQDVINQFSSIEQIDGKKGKNPLYAVRQFLGTKGIVESIINDGTVDVSGIKIEKNGEGLKNIVDDFISRSSAIEEDSQVAMEDLQRWLIAQRTLDNMTKEDVYVSDEQKQEAVEDIAYIADKYASDMPVIEETAKRIYDFQHRILEMFVQSGMKSKEWFDEVTKAHPHYVPFKRVFEEDELSDVSGVGARFSDVKTGIKQLKGSDRQIENVFESIIKNVYTTTNKALRNRVAVNVAKLKKEFPMLMRSAKPKLVMDENGNVVGAEKPAGNIIEYYTKGERHWLEVTDDLYDALGSLATAQDKGVLELITNILSVPAQTLRVGATITPEFFVRNFIRDSYGAAIQTNFGFNPVVDPAFGLASVLKKDEMYYRWLRSGGAYSGLVDIGKESMKSAVAELTKDPSLIERLNIIGHLEAMSMAVERANRVGLFRSALKSGMSEMEASYQSREGTLDFGVKGSKTAKLNQMIAFFNARIQGADKFIRTAKEDPVGTTLRSLMWVTAPQLAFYALAYFSGDDEYFDIPRWQRDMFYIIKIGDIHYRIPKPFVYGQLFGSTVERFLDYVRENDPNEFKEMMNMIWDSLSPTSDIQSVLPTALAPLIEDATNYSFFRGMSLYPEYKEKMMPYMQYGKGTSLTSQIIGEKFNLSPAKIDNIVSGYFGTSGKYATNATDFLAREIKKAKGETVAERPMDIQDAPVLRGFMVPQVTGYKSESVNKLMDKAREIDKIRLTISAEKKAGRRDKAEELSKEHKKELRAYKVIDNAQKAIKELDKNNTAIAKKDYDMKKKREIIDRNEKQMTQKAKKALALYKSMMQ